MSNGSVLPPDIKAQIERQNRRQGHVGIGGAAQENQVASQRRNAAVNPDAVAEAEEAPAKETAKEPELKTCPNARCRVDLVDEWSFCAKCGTDLMRGGAATALGITFTEEDLEQYLFRGYLVRDLKILGKHTISVKTAQPQDMDEIDELLLNGSWSKNKDGTPRQVSQVYLNQMNSLCISASCILKYDGESIGKTLEDRVKYLREKGAAVVDMMSSRVQLLNRAITEHVKKEDTLSGF